MFYIGENITPVLTFYMGENMPPVLMFYMGGDLILYGRGSNHEILLFMIYFLQLRICLTRPLYLLPYRSIKSIKIR